MARLNYLNDGKRKQFWEVWLSVTHAVRESQFLKDNANRNDGVKRVKERPECEREGEPQQTVRGW